MRARLLSVFGRPAAPSLGLGILVAASFVVVETLGMLVLRQLSPLEVFGTLYLLGVVVVSTVWGLVLAMATSVVSAIVLTSVTGRLDISRSTSRTVWSSSVFWSSRC